MNRRTYLWFLKLLIGVGLLAVLVVTADFRAIVAQLRSVDLAWLAAMFLVPHVALWLNTVKWQALLRCQASTARLGPLYTLYLIGNFFNNFLPSMIGGDIVRVLQLRRVEPRTELAIASTFLERFLGFGGMVSVLPLVWLFPSVRETIPAVTYVAAAAVAAYVAVFVLVFSPLDMLPKGTPNNPLVGRGVDVLRRSQLQVRAYRSKVGVLLWSYLLSLVFNLSAGLTVWLAAQSVGGDANLLHLIALTPLVLLVASLPISVNGLGVFESGLVLLLTMLSVPLPEAVACSVLLRIRLLFTSAVGGVLFLLWRSRSPYPAHAERKYV